jgi:hypothetical protein
MTKANKTGSLKTLKTTPYVFEQYVTTTMPPTAISTGSPQATFTYSASAYAPIFSGSAKVVSYKAVFGAGISGQNTTGATVTLNYQINKNGSSWKTGSTNVTNNYYYTAYFVDAPNDGDIYDIYIWSSAVSGMTFNYEFMWALPTSVDTGAKNVYNATFNISNVNASLALTGNAATTWTGNVYVGVDNGTSSTGPAVSVTNGATIPMYTPNKGLKLWTPQNTAPFPFGGVSVGYTANTGQPATLSYSYASSVSYREIYLR